MHSRIASLAVASLFVATPVLAQDSGLAADAKAFGIRPSAEDVDVSPSGTKLLTIDPGPGKTSILTIVDLTTGAQKPILRSSADPEALYWCKFASDTQLICKYGGGTYVDSDLIGFTRLITMDVNGGNIRQLGQPSHFQEEGLRQYDGEILDWLPADPGSVLMERNYLRESGTTGTRFIDGRDGLGIDRIDLATLKVTEVEPPQLMAAGYMTDGRGNVRLMAFSGESGGELNGVIEWRYQPLGSRDWRPFATYRERDDSGTEPLAVDASCDCAYVLRKLDGRDALYTIKLDGSMATKLVAANKDVDIGSVVRFGRGQRVIGYHYTNEKGHAVYFDDEFTRLADGLAHVLPHQPIVDFVESSADGTRLLIFAGGDTDPGTFYLYNKINHHLDEVEPLRPALEGRTLAHVQPIKVPSPDGVQIPAYLTLPPNRAAKNLPAVILPHGGPSSRDYWGFDWLSQFLAARGYAVIQPEYRGSAGYGEKWMGANGFRDWRKAIGDVTASARYLVTNGIADPQRMAIVGWSYGGYAALQSVAVEPKLYKVAVAIAPVTDLNLLKEEAEHYTNYELVRAFVGSGPEVVEGSPLRHAAQIKVPVLMFQGDMDRNVNVEQSEKMADALRGAGDKAELVRFKGLDHQLDDSDARVTMLTRIGEFLDSAIGH